jgi:hypothetical protein
MTEKDRKRLKLKKGAKVQERKRISVRYTKGGSIMETTS